MPPVAVPVEALRHEVLHAIQFEEPALAHLDAAGERLAENLVFLLARILHSLRRELDEPVLVSVRQITRSREEIPCLAVPPDDRLRLRPAGGRPDADDLPERVRAAHLGQPLVERKPRLLHKLPHVESRRLASLGSALRLKGERTHTARSDIRKTVKDGNRRSRNAVLLHPPVDERVAERIRQGIGEDSRDAHELLLRHTHGRGVEKSSLQRQHERRNLKSGPHEFRIVLKDEIRTRLRCQ